MEKLYGVIMAGGDGKRFWPESRKRFPKQFLRLIGDNILLDQTYERLESVIDQDNIYVVTNTALSKVTLEESEKIQKTKQLIEEPIGRNTSACIALATRYIWEINSRQDAILVITPADAYIPQTDVFSEYLNEGVILATESNSIITLGIKPTYPSTDYGYIERGMNVKKNNAFVVKSFKEKPELDTAIKYINNPDFLWNSGIFIARLSVLIHCFQEFLPRLWEIIETISVTNPQTDKYEQLENISFDYGVMEKCTNRIVIQCDMNWSDLGTWQSIEKYSNPDGDGNITRGNNLLVSTKGSTVISSELPIITYGVNDLLIVAKDDLIFVCDKDKTASIKLLLSQLEDHGFDNLL